MDLDHQAQSLETARVAVLMALSQNRDEESALKATYARRGFRVAAADYGGDFLSLLKKGVDRAVTAAEREGLISPVHSELGAVAGAAKEALSQILPKALGMSVGGKIGIARRGDHLTVAVFLGVGLLHFNDVAIAIGHRSLPGRKD